MRLYASSSLPGTPFAHLIGFAIGHVSAGTLTGRMKASGHLAFIPYYNLSPLYDFTAYACAVTAIGPSTDLEPIAVTAHAYAVKS